MKSLTVIILTHGNETLGSVPSLSGCNHCFIHTHIYCFIHTHTYTALYTHTYCLIHTHIYCFIHTDIYCFIHTHTHYFIHTHTHTYTYTSAHTLSVSGLFWGTALWSISQYEPCTGGRDVSTHHHRHTHCGNSIQPHNRHKDTSASKLPHGKMCTSIYCTHTAATCKCHTQFFV